MMKLIRVENGYKINTKRRVKKMKGNNFCRVGGKYDFTTLLATANTVHAFNQKKSSLNSHINPPRGPAAPTSKGSGT